MFLLISILNFSIYYQKRRERVRKRERDRVEKIRETEIYFRELERDSDRSTEIKERYNLKYLHVILISLTVNNY